MPLNDKSIRELDESFRVLFYGSPQPIIIYDRNDLQIVEANEAALRFYGYSQEEFYGMDILDLRPEEEREKFISFLKAHSHDDIQKQFRHQLKNGDIRIVEVVSHLVTFRGRDCRISNVIDVTSKIEQSQNLKRLLDISRSLTETLDLKNILQQVTDVTTEVSHAEFGAFFYNRINEDVPSMELYTLSGADKATFEHLGFPKHTSIFHPTTVNSQVVRIGDILQDERYGKNPPHYGMPKGHLSLRSYMAIPVISNSGNVLGSLLFGHRKPNVFTEESEQLVLGIASHAAIAIDNARHYEEISELNNKKDEFLSVASHELKTPITNIKGYLQLMQREALKENTRLEFLHVANKQVNKITRLVDDLLDLSKITAGKLQYRIAEFPIDELLRDCVNYVSTNYNHPVVINGDTSLHIVGDLHRIEQVVCNLLSNAAKYAPGSQPITIRIIEGPEHVRLEISDKGKGIPKDRLQHVFDRFYRAEDHSYQTSGLGLGLYIASEIVKAHNGTIGAVSEVGKGTTFWFSLPHSLVALAHDSKQLNSNQGAATA